MKYTNIHQAKTNLSQYIELVAKEGKEVIICRAGNPVAKLINYQPSHSPRTPGIWKNKVQISDDFNEVDANINKLFYSS